MICRSDIKIIEDTRQKQGKHENVSRFFAARKIAVERRKLDVGDYVIEGNDRIAVDTKTGLSELCMDFGSESGRFRREMERAHEMGVRLIFLIEEAGYTKISDVEHWKNPNHAGKALFMSGKELAKRMWRAKVSYGVDFAFCDKKNVGEALIAILTQKSEEEDL